MSPKPPGKGPVTERDIVQKTKSGSEKRAFCFLEKSEESPVGQDTGHGRQGQQRVMTQQAESKSCGAHQT